MEQAQEQAEKVLAETKAISFDRQTLLEEQIRNVVSQGNAIAAIVRQVAEVLGVDANEAFKDGLLAKEVSDKLALVNTETD